MPVFESRRRFRRRSNGSLASCVHRIQQDGLCSPDSSLLQPQHPGEDGQQERFGLSAAGPRLDDDISPSLDRAQRVLLVGIQGRRAERPVETCEFWVPAAGGEKRIELFEQAGFLGVTERGSFSTVCGTLALYSAVKPSQARHPLATTRASVRCTSACPSGRALGAAARITGGWLRLG